MSACHDVRRSVLLVLKDIRMENIISQQLTASGDVLYGTSPLGANAIQYDVANKPFDGTGRHRCPSAPRSAAPPSETNGYNNWRWNIVFSHWMLTFIVVNVYYLPAS